MVAVVVVELTVVLLQSMKFGDQLRDTPDFSLEMTFVNPKNEQLMC